jgi:hypothetical protein
MLTVPRPQAFEALRAKYEITDQERATIEMLLRATLQIVRPSAGEDMGVLSERSGFSRQTLYVWAGRIVFVMLWMLRKMPTGLAIGQAGARCGVALAERCYN